MSVFFSDIGLNFLFSVCGIFVWFWYQTDGGLTNEFGRVLSSTIFEASFRRADVNSVNSCVNVLYNSPVMSSDPGLFLV